MSTHFLSGRLALAVAALMLAPVAHAHVTLETRQAPVESGYNAVLKVPHGCKGSPTIKLRVRIPDGVLGVKPQPKAGWTLQTVTGDYTQPYTLYGAPVSSGVQEVVWSGGSLPDEHYDEFVFTAYLSSALKPGATVYFPVIQECEQGLTRWIDQPAPGHTPASDHSDSPAPGLKLLPKP